METIVHVGTLRLVLSTPRSPRFEYGVFALKTGSLFTVDFCTLLFMTIHRPAVQNKDVILLEIIIILVLL